MEPGEVGWFRLKLPGRGINRPLPVLKYGDGGGNGTIPLCPLWLLKHIKMLGNVLMSYDEEFLA